jgi:hypothetical protein
MEYKETTGRFTKSFKGTFIRDNLNYEELEE